MLPIIPAFLLFKLLPSNAVLRGPFKGFKLNLGGAFAGYFALVILIFSTKNGVWDPIPPADQVWIVTGTVNDNSGDPIFPLGPEDISVLPPPSDLSPGWFTVEVPVLAGQGGTQAYPTLSISHTGYLPSYISLDPNSKPQNYVTFDAADRTVHISNLQLEPLPAYQPVAPMNLPPTTPGSGPKLNRSEDVKEIH
jgi:hypothetical protein